MSDAPPSFFARLALAFAVLFDGELAARVARVRVPAGEPEPKRPSLGAEHLVRDADERSALLLLGLLQREGRLVDFLEEDVASFPDAQIGAAARVVHEGCRKALREHLPLEPVRPEAEGARVRVEVGYDPVAVRVVGGAKEPPFEGTLAHRGYRVREVKLPRVHEAHDARLIAPAEITP